MSKNLVHRWVEGVEILSPALQMRIWFRIVKTVPINMLWTTVSQHLCSLSFVKIASNNYRYIPNVLTLKLEQVYFTFGYWFTLLQSVFFVILLLLNIKVKIQYQNIILYMDICMSCHLLPFPLLAGALDSFNNVIVFFCCFLPCHTLSLG